MELLQGCRNLAEQRWVEKQLQTISIYWPTLADCQRGYQRLRRLSTEPRPGFNRRADRRHCRRLAARLLATFNVKHYAVIAGLTTVQPY